MFGVLDVFVICYFILWLFFSSNFFLLLTISCNFRFFRHFASFLSFFPSNQCFYPFLHVHLSWRFFMFRGYVHTHCAASHYHVYVKCLDMWLCPGDAVHAEIAINWIDERTFRANMITRRAGKKEHRRRKQRHATINECLYDRILWNALAFNLSVSWGCDAFPVLHFDGRIQWKWTCRRNCNRSLRNMWHLVHYAEKNSKCTFMKRYFFALQNGKNYPPAEATLIKWAKLLNSLAHLGPEWRRIACNGISVVRARFFVNSVMVCTFPLIAWFSFAH